MKKELEIDYDEFLNAVLDAKCMMFVDSSSTAKNIKFTPVIYGKNGFQNMWFLFKSLGFKYDLKKKLVICPHTWCVDKHSIIDEFFKRAKEAGFDVPTDSNSYYYHVQEF
jgi:calcineurin-like phosphoesterase